MQTVSTMREKLFTMRMNDEESARFDRVAEKYGLTLSGVVRMLMKREDDAAQASAPARRKKSTAKAKAKAKR